MLIVGCIIFLIGIVGLFTLIIEVDKGDRLTEESLKDAIKDSPHFTYKKEQTK